MNELSSLILQNRKLNYIINQQLNYEEYKILLFVIEEQARKYTKHHISYRAYESLKEKLLKNHKLFNASPSREDKI